VNLSDTVRTTSFRQACLFGLFFVGSFSILFIFIFWRTAVYETARIDRVITDDARLLAEERDDAVVELVSTHITSDFHRIRLAALFDASGRRIAGDLERPPLDLPLDGAVHVIKGIRSLGAATQVEDVRAAGRRREDGKIVVIGRTADSVARLRELVIDALLLGAIPAFLMALVAAVFLSRQAQERVRAVHSAAERIVMGHLDERLPIRGRRDELDRLSEIFNGVLDELARLLTEIRATGDEIAHDLRTPLTRVRARLERALNTDPGSGEMQDIVARAITGLDQALAIITALLRIREIENDQRRLGFRSVNVAEVAALLDDLYQPIAEVKGISLELEVEPTPPLFADRDLLIEAIGNLVDNAIKFTPAGGQVRLSVIRRANSTVVRIADTGPGIPQDERDLVFARFYRSPQTRHLEGTGLGLSLVSAIAHLHGFAVRIGDGQPGCVIDLIARHANPFGQWLAPHPGAG
jgi:signal transduction histidine kinase